MNNLEEITLDNGLRIYFYQDKRKHSTFFQHVTLFGGVTKDFMMDGKEYHYPDGVAHILEHYVVECNDEGNFIKELGEAQMNTNASTHHHMTRFYLDAVEDVLFGIQKMLQGIYHVSFHEEKLEKLKKPIYQEIRGRKNSKFYHADNIVMKNLFHHDTFKNTGGSLEEVESVTIEDIKTCYEAFYQPSNQIIVIAGNFNKKEVLKEIKDFYKNLDFPKHEVKVLPIHEEDTVSKKSDILYFPTPEEYIDINFKINISKLFPKEKLDLDYFLGNFFGNTFGVTSSLYQEFVKNKVITSSINCQSFMIYDYLIVNVGGYTSKKNVFKKRVLETIQEMNSFDEEYFDLEKKNTIMRLILRDENIISMIMPFVDNLVDFQYPYLDTVEDIENVTFDDYVSAIKNLDWSNYTIITIKNPKDKEKISN